MGTGIATANDIEEQESLPPSLQFCIFCDLITKADGFGEKPVFVGIFDRLVRPGVVPQFFVATRWINGLGEHTTSIHILNPELETIFVPDPKERVFVLHNRTQAVNFRYGIVNFMFPKPGVYWVEVYLDGEVVASYPLPVFDIDQQKS